MEKLMVEYCEGKFVPKKMCSIGRDGLVDDCDSCTEHCTDAAVENDLCEGCAIQECFNRLGEYEATNLTPDQMLQIDKMYQELSEDTVDDFKMYISMFNPEVIEEHMTTLKRIIHNHGTLRELLDECEEYKEIGTVEECREAVEKQRAKKPHGKYALGTLKIGECPSCHMAEVSQENFCGLCGQKLDWGDGE